ncbi:hypothetical protein R6Q59_016278, partial [Mikania micrantha]
MQRCESFVVIERYYSKMTLDFHTKGIWWWSWWIWWWCWKEMGSFCSWITSLLIP